MGKRSRQKALPGHLDYITHYDSKTGTVTGTFTWYHTQKAGMTPSSPSMGSPVWAMKIITPGGIEMDPEKVSAVMSWEAPDSKRSLQRFLGFANFYRRFIKHFSIIAGPLYELTKKTEDWHWEDQHQKSFEALKKALSRLHLHHSKVLGGNCLGFSRCSSFFESSGLCCCRCGERTAQAGASPTSWQEQNHSNN